MTTHTALLNIHIYAEHTQRNPHTLEQSLKKIKDSVLLRKET